MQIRDYAFTKIWLWLFMALVAVQLGGLLANAADPSVNDPFVEYKWSHRLLIATSDNTSKEHTKTAKAFFDLYECEVTERNLRLITYDRASQQFETLPKEMQTKNGLWLIGYDGTVKAYSADETLLVRLFDIIDGMSIRKQEMVQADAPC